MVTFFHKMRVIGKPTSEADNYLHEIVFFIFWCYSYLLASECFNV